MSYKRFEQNVIYLDQVDSTNDYLLALSKESKLPNGTSLVAHHQSKGKGQRLATWTTQAGKNLTCSTIFYPTLQIQAAFCLNMCASLAVQNVLQDLGIRAQIKWPNDILVDGKKICGILVENSVQGKSIAQSIIGIGLNINQTDFEGTFKATSISAELGEKIDVNEIHQQLLAYLDFWLDWMEQKNFRMIEQRYLKHLYQLNEKHEYQDQNGRFEGEIVGLSESGLLKMKTDAGMRLFDIKDVKYL